MVRGHKCHTLVGFRNNFFILKVYIDPSFPSQRSWVFSSKASFVRNTNLRIFNSMVGPKVQTSRKMPPSTSFGGDVNLVYWFFGVSKNRGFPPKSSILIGFFHYKPFILGCFPIFGNIHLMMLPLDSRQIEFLMMGKAKEIRLYKQWWGNQMWELDLLLGLAVCFLKVHAFFFAMANHQFESSFYAFLPSPSFGHVKSKHLQARRWPHELGFDLSKLVCFLCVRNFWPEVCAAHVRVA